MQDHHNRTYKIITNAKNTHSKAVVEKTSKGSSISSFLLRERFLPQRRPVVVFA